MLRTSGRAEALGGEAKALRGLGRYEDALASYDAVLELQPGLAPAHNGRGLVLQTLGRLEEAEGAFRRAAALEPARAGAHSNLAHIANYFPGRSAAEVFEPHRDFDRRFGQPAVAAPGRNAPDARRRIRVGYVSADFRQHAVASFIEPVLAHHDRGQVEVVCYYNFPRSDAMTERLKRHADRWRDIPALHDEALANLIREDAIDLLVDLGGHTRRNRLLAFARKPAPVQATWLGYLNTTGLRAMDWRITDSHATPQGPLEALHSERLWRLPDSQWCYQPPRDAPEVSPPPGAAAGFFTFGAFCRPAKINGRVMDLWSRVLDEVPGSRLLVIANGLGAVPAGYVERFTRCGIPGERLRVMGSQRLAAYLALHGSVDAMLDTFPYTAGTTACDALWMGVPLVTLAGDTATSRGGASLLHAVGLGELVAATPDQYVEIAASLARAPARLAALRAGLRERVRASPLADAERFTRNLETAYRAMWGAWCERQR